MVEAAGVRITWADLPAHVRAGVEDVLGDRVVDHASQRGGFSPGTADRVVTAGGRRAFVKAVSPDLDAFAAQLHRHEARVTALLPATVPAPALIGTHDDDEWIALVLQDVEGVQPALPWRADQLDAVLAALARLAAAPVPAALADLPTAADESGPLFEGWSRLAHDAPTGLDPWARAHLDDLVDLAGRSGGALAGPSLVHGDTRSDNLLVRHDGTVVVVDWPSATVGCGWFDTLSVLLDVRLRDDAREHDVDALIAAAARGVDPGAVDAVLAGMAGYFVDAARRPAPARLPTLRAFQAAEGRAALTWLRERLA